ncbi:MAG: PD40 domain-containing protein [Candidatus Riflebacteria bacterium]|nr:PD40 domain-containing protein [Candidatus Riflebacteria bacterium]
MALFVLSGALAVSYTQLIDDLRGTKRLSDDTTHLYLAEAIMAKAINRLKKVPWSQRWYAQPGAVPSDRGTYRDADYYLSVQDVADTTGTALRDQTDIFLKVNYLDQSLNYLERVRVRVPSETRPTQANIRRMMRTSENVETRSGKSMALVRLEREESEREARRAATNVLGRFARHLLAQGLPPARVVEVLRRGDGRPAVSIAWWRQLLEGAQFLLRPRAAYAGIGQDESAREENRAERNVLSREALDPAFPRDAASVAVRLRTTSYATQVELEKTILEKILEGDRILFAVPPAGGALPAAIAAYEEALRAAESQDAVNRVETIPRCLYRLAAAKTAQAEGHVYDLFDSRGNLQTRLSGPPSRTDLLDEAGALYARIVRDHPNSVEAPHAYIPWAWTEMKKVPGTNAGAWNAARSRAYVHLEELRRKYPLYHLWDEEAIVSVPGSPGALAPISDELVYYVETQIKPRMLWTRSDPYLGSDAYGNYRVTFIVVGDPDYGNVRPLFPPFALTKAPTVSPDGSRIAFLAFVEKRWDLFLANSDGSDVRQLTRDLVEVDNPSFSPTGREITFNSRRSGTWAIYSIGADGGGLRRIAAISGDCGRAPISPNGQSIAFASAGSSGRVAIWVGNADGSNLRQLTDPSSGINDYDPSWSPDGTELLFSREPGYPCQIWLMRADGSGQHALTNRSAHPEQSYSASWSPDGGKIAMVNGERWYGWPAQMNRDGTGFRRCSSESMGRCGRAPIFAAGAP